MANHKWKNNVCLNCGIVREKQEYKKLQRTYSKLINGIFEDVPVYNYGMAWFYNGVSFERPDCKMPNRIVGVQESDTTGDDSCNAA